MCVSSDAIGEKREKANAKAPPKIDTPCPRITTGETSRSPFLVNKSSSCRWTGGGAFLTQPTDWPDTARHLPRHGLRTVGTVKRVLRKNDACPIEMQCFAMVAWNRSIRIEALRLDWGIRPRPEVRKLPRQTFRSSNACTQVGYGYRFGSCLNLSPHCVCPQPVHVDRASPASISKNWQQIVNRLTLIDLLRWTFWRTASGG